MSRTYICGPMTGLPDLNFPAFHAEAARLRALGIEVVSPAEINSTAKVFTDRDELLAHWRKCMRLDIAALMTCDRISLLPGWDRSRGATVEHFNAWALGMPVLHAGQEISA